MEQSRALQDAPDLPDALRTQGLLLIISGPSGVGKSTIAHHIERSLGGVFSVSVTTRPRSREDTEGVDYRFVSTDQFDRMKSDGELLESAEVFGHRYGTPRQPVVEALSAGKLLILEIDVQGAEQVRAKLPEAFGLFICPPSEGELLRRLRGRGREGEDVIQHRYAKAKDEIARARTCGAYDAFQINEDLETAKHQAVEIVRQEWVQRGGRPMADAGAGGSASSAGA